MTDVAAAPLPNIEDAHGSQSDCPWRWEYLAAEAAEKGHAVYMLTRRGGGLHVKLDMVHFNNKYYLRLRTWPDLTLRRDVEVSRDRSQPKRWSIGDALHLAAEQEIEKMLGATAKPKAKAGAKGAAAPHRGVKQCPACYKVLRPGIEHGCEVKR